jgi:hypothetical protein
LANCYHHAVSSARKYGGEPEEWIDIHLWFDEPKGHVGDFRQRALRHHTFGITEALERFGETRMISTGKIVPVRFICEQHMIEDFGRIPSVQDWLSCLRPEAWMARHARPLSRELEM